MSDISAAGRAPAFSADVSVTPPWRRQRTSSGHECLRELWPQVLEAVARRSKVTWVVISQHVQLIATKEGQVQLGFWNPVLCENFTGSRREQVLLEALREITGSNWNIGAMLVSRPPAHSAPVTVEPVPDPAAALRIVRLRSGKLHVTADGIKTACGTLIPDRATTTQATPEWYLHTNCYNCTHRLWPQHGPREYLQPSNGRDFPPRRKCPHGTAPESCFECTPVQRDLRNWPCPNGCTEPRDHDPRRGAPKCVVYPEGRVLGPDGRCAEGCESIERAMDRANPRLFLDLADSALTTCFGCGEPVCIQCQSAPVEEDLAFCGTCEQAI